jgi:hypothetical protein
VLVPATAERPPYDALRDFAPVINLHRSIKALFVPGALPPRTLAEFVEYAKARPGVLNYATGGAGSSNHVDMELFRASAGIDLAHIPYNGPAAGIAAVASGEAQAMIVSVTTGIGAAQAHQARAGKLTKPADLLQPADARHQVRLGDFVLANDKVAVYIEAAGDGQRSDGYFPYGGEVLATEPVIDLLLEGGGYEPSLGARPMRRAIARHVEAPLAEAVLRGKLRRGDRAVLVAREGRVALERTSGSLIDGRVASHSAAAHGPRHS